MLTDNSSPVISITLLVVFLVDLLLSLDPVVDFSGDSGVVPLTTVFSVVFVRIIDLHTETFESIVSISYITRVYRILSALFFLTETGATPSHFLHQHGTFVVFT